MFTQYSSLVSKNLKGSWTLAILVRKVWQQELWYFHKKHPNIFPMNPSTKSIHFRMLWNGLRCMHWWPYYSWSHLAEGISPRWPAEEPAELAATGMLSHKCWWPQFGSWKGNCIHIFIIKHNSFRGPSINRSQKCMTQTNISNQSYDNIITSKRVTGFSPQRWTSVLYWIQRGQRHRPRAGEPGAMHSMPWQCCVWCDLPAVDPGSSHGQKSYRISLNVTWLKMMDKLCRK